MVLLASGRYVLLSRRIEDSRDNWISLQCSGVGRFPCEILLPSTIALWVLTDARNRKLPLPYDSVSYFFFAWPILVPIYLFSTRGRRAFAVTGWFLLLYLASAVFGSIP